MLVLTRKPGEQIVVGDNIRITVVTVGPGRVKIGVEAPADVKVDRGEIHQRKIGEAEAAPAAEPPALHNRVADRLPDAAPAEPAAAAPAPVESRLRKVGRFLPRKPR